MTDKTPPMPETASDVGLWPLVLKLLGAIRHCVLATADSAGRPCSAIPSG